jgi:hypothetical protein
MEAMEQVPLLVSRCPSCGGSLQVRKLWCTGCAIAIEGEFTLGVLTRLQPEEQQFVIEFVRASGSLKEMARKFKVSYPTVRNRLDELIAHVEQLEKESEPDGTVSTGVS